MRFNLLSVYTTLLVLLLALSGYGQKNDPATTTEKFDAMLQIINYAYVDTVNEPELVEKAIVAALKELDPHSQYISKEALRKANEPLEGNFEGIGISFQIYKDTILVISPIPGGPSEKVGIMAGDKIVKIDGENATGEKLNNNFVFEKLRGKKDTPVEVSILRKGKRSFLDFTIIRDMIPINSIDAAFMATPSTGYIRLNRFSRTTMDEFTYLLGTLEEEGMKNLILDLRGNSGGYLDVAIDLADEFLGYGKLVLYTQGYSSPKRKYKTTFRGKFESGKLAILIDEGSASASEIVAGAVQDWDRGIIVGRRSFGKGLVQRPYYLPDSSVIRLTIARYYTPTGRCIQKSYKEGYEQYYEDLSKRLEHGELSTADSINFPDSLKYYTPHNRVVYGGGGIMPDVFVPWDSTKYSDFYVDLLSKGIFIDFVLDYIDKERQDLNKKYHSFEQFDKGFNVNKQFMKLFSEFAREKGVDPTSEFAISSDLLVKFQLKALLARNLYDFNSYFRVMTQIDDSYLKALKVLEDKIYFSELSIK
jgi:carboxyl-terminal processing protease